MRTARSDTPVASTIARLCLLALLLPGLGCVTQGTYDELQAQRDQLEAQRDAIAAERDELALQLGDLSTINEDLRRELIATESEVENLRGTYDELVNELQAEVAAGQIEITQLRDGVRLNVSDELLFASGSATVNQTGQAVLVRVAEQIRGDGAVISVEGHTDDVPISSTLASRFPTNWELAAARASGVVRILSDNGVEPERLRAVSRGPFAPVASNDTAEGRAKNRRTEIILRRIAQ